MKKNRSEMNDDEREKRRAENRAWNARNKEIVREAVRRYRAKNSGQWSEQHIGKRKERIKRYYEKNKEKYLAWGHARRSRMTGAGGTYTQDDIERLYEKQDGLCGTCWSILLGEYEIDHIVPVSKGGSSDPDNLQLLCRTCNRSKHAKDNEEFKKLKGYV